MAKVPRRILFRPRHASLLVGAHQHTLAFLAHVYLALEVDAVKHFRAGTFVDFDDLRHFLSQDVHMLHGQHR